MTALRNRLIRGGIASLAIRVGSIALTLAGSVVLARALGVAGYGAYALAMSTMSILAIPVHAGLPTLVLRETAAADTHGDLARMKGIWAWAARIVLATSALLLIGCAAAWFFRPSLVPAVFALSMGLVPLVAAGAVRAAALKGLRHVVAAQLPDNVVRPGLLAAGVAGAAWIAGGALTAETAMALHLGAALCGFAVGAAFLLRVRPEGLRSVSADMTESRAWLRALAPIALISGMQVLNQNAGLVIIGLLRPDADAALYRVALSASAFVLIGLQVITLPFEPLFVRAHQSHDMAGLQKAASASAASGFLASVPLAAAFWAGGAWLLGLLYGSAYADAAGLLSILVLGQMVRSYFGSCETVLVLTGHETQSMRIWIAAIAIGLALSVGLGLRHGAIGVAWAGVISATIIRAGQWLAVRRLLGIDTALHSSFAFARARAA